MGAGFIRKPICGAGPQRSCQLRRLPQMLGERFDGQPLFAAHLALADAQLVGDRIAAKLAQILQAQGVIDTPGARLRRFVVGRL